MGEVIFMNLFALSVSAATTAEGVLPKNTGFGWPYPSPEVLKRQHQLSVIAA